MTDPDERRSHLVNPQHRVVLDTDIGTDVDDAMALAVILGSPDIDLAGVTTVYGDTVLRARLAQRYARLGGSRIVAVPGAGETLSGKAVWWPGHEGTLHEDLAEEEIDADSDAAGFLIRSAAEADGQLDVIAIGPLTNIAVAIQREPAFARRVRHLWIMGGVFGREDTEHNFRSDVTAAEIVFASSIPATVVALDVTERIRLTTEQLGIVGSAGPLGSVLLADIRQWWEFWGIEWNVPHDPLAVLALTNPELFTLSDPGRVLIGADGASRFVPGPGGNVRLVSDLDVDATVDGMIARIAAAASVREQHP